MIPTRGTDSTLEPAYFAKMPEKCENGGGDKPTSDSSSIGLAIAVANGLIGEIGEAKQVYEKDIDLMSESWEQGSLSNSTGSESSSSTRIRMSEYFDISTIENFKNKYFSIKALTNEQALMFSWELYSTDKSFISSSLNNWYNSEKFTLPGSDKDIAYIRIILRKSNDGNITPDELTSVRFLVSQ